MNYNSIENHSLKYSEKNYTPHFKYQTKSNYTLYNHDSKDKNFILKNNINNIQDEVIFKKKTTKLRNIIENSEMKEENKFQTCNKNDFYNESKIHQQITSSPKSINQISEKHNKSVSNKNIKIRSKNYIYNNKTVNRINKHNSNNICDNKFLFSNNIKNNYYINISKSPIINHHNFNSPISPIQIVKNESLGLNLNNNPLLRKKKIIKKRTVQDDNLYFNSKKSTIQISKENNTQILNKKQNKSIKFQKEEIDNDLQNNNIFLENKINNKEILISNEKQSLNSQNQKVGKFSKSNSNNEISMPINVFSSKKIKSKDNITNDSKINNYIDKSNSKGKNNINDNNLSKDKKAINKSNSNLKTENKKVKTITKYEKKSVKKTNKKKNNSIGKIASKNIKPRKLLKLDFEKINLRIKRLDSDGKIKLDSYNIKIKENNDNNLQLIKDVIKDICLDESYLNPILNIVNQSVSILNNINEINIKNNSKNKIEEFFKKNEDMENSNDVNDSLLLEYIEDNKYKKYFEETVLDLVIDEHIENLNMSI